MRESKKELDKKVVYTTTTFRLSKEQYELMEEVRAIDGRSQLGEYMWLLKRRLLEIQSEEASLRRKAEEFVAGRFYPLRATEPGSESSSREVVRDPRKRSRRQER